MTTKIINSVPVVGLLVFLMAPQALAKHVPLGDDLERAGYEEIAFKKGVKVYKHRKSKTIRIGAEGRIDASPQQILAALLDYHHQVGQIDRLSESRILRHGERQMLVYQRLNLPVISDRDFTLRVTWWQKGGVTYVSYRALRDAGPKPRRGVVRVTRHSGTWQIKQLEGCNSSLVRFQVGIDLAGWLPMWMARSGAGKELPDLFASVKKMVASKKHRRVACIPN